MKLQKKNGLRSFLLLWNQLLRLIELQCTWLEESYCTFYGLIQFNLKLNTVYIL